MPRKSLHVVPNLSGGWSVRSYGTVRSYRRFPDRAQAVACGHTLAQARRRELVIHKNDGSVQTKTHYELPEAHSLPVLQPATSG